MQFANAKIEKMMWEYVRNVKDEHWNLKKVRAQVKMHQLRSRNPLESDELIADRTLFQGRFTSNVKKFSKICFLETVWRIKYLH